MLMSDCTDQCPVKGIHSDWIASLSVPPKHFCCLSIDWLVFSQSYFVMISTSYIVYIQFPYIKKICIFCRRLCQGKSALHIATEELLLHAWPHTNLKELLLVLAGRNIRLVIFTFVSISIQISFLHKCLSRLRPVWMIRNHMWPTFSLGFVGQLLIGFLSNTTNQVVCPK